MQVWRNWQTRMVQVHMNASSCRFKSCYPHQSRASTRKSRSGLFFLYGSVFAFIAGIYFVDVSHQAEPGRNSRSGLSFYFTFGSRLWQVSFGQRKPNVGTGSLVPIFYFMKNPSPVPLSLLSAKGHARLTCSVAGARTTLWRATIFLWPVIL